MCNADLEPLTTTNMFLVLPPFLFSFFLFLFLIVFFPPLLPGADKWSDSSPHISHLSNVIRSLSKVELWIYDKLRLCSTTEYLNRLFDLFVETHRYDLHDEKASKRDKASVNYVVCETTLDVLQQNLSRMSRRMAARGGPGPLEEKVEEEEEMRLREGAGTGSSHLLSSLVKNTNTLWVECLAPMYDMLVHGEVMTKLMSSSGKDQAIKRRTMVKSLLLASTILSMSCHCRMIKEKNKVEMNKGEGEVLLERSVPILTQS